jgi:hypothetical protein
MQHLGIMSDQWGCSYYVNVYKFGWLVNIVRLMVFVNIVWFMMSRKYCATYGAYVCR